MDGYEPYAELRVYTKLMVYVDQAILNALVRPEFLQDDLFRYIGVDMKDADTQWSAGNLDE